MPSLNNEKFNVAINHRFFNPNISLYWITKINSQFKYYSELHNTIQFEDKRHCEFYKAVFQLCSLHTYANKSSHMEC